ncbi:hypothetical protein [Haloparvum sedimenti]|uniref:hypothetical protein n=1 Tax=Haloparvum sedimenti TaxID=1678448 RepID=UPI00071E7099|nr:hypothetical protein [Haloparvum sedimenti]
MTTIQTLANFLESIRLEKPDAVLVDDAVEHVLRLRDAAEGEDAIPTTPDGRTRPRLPDLVRRGVCTYTPATGALHRFVGFDCDRLEEADADTLAATLADRVDPAAVREVSVSVDRYNGFSVRLPQRGYCAETDFEAFRRRVDYDTTVGIVGPTDSTYRRPTGERVDDR